MKKIFNRIAGPLGVLGFGLLLLAEARRPLRKQTSGKLRRATTNIGIAAVTGLAVRLLFLPVVWAVADFAQTRRVGLLHRLPLPRALRFAAELALLDYTLYWWHRLMHRNALLWRCHMVHHTDLDLDVLTAGRFHFAEYVLSVGYRAAQVMVIGASPAAIAISETCVMMAAEFHHSNLRLPLGFERRLNALVVTPRMHGIHHSIIEQESNSNFATVLTLWDAAHGTLKLNVPQHEITIGLAAHRDAEELTLAKLLALPFGRQKDAWALPDNSRPERKRLAAARTEMSG
ncbi:MAG TPA: sterol desaturase family protein [Blastocatellia bacterium]|jgi:sterol desaturase/sphingolipid hydroxylase (fatty acid hydroxylase superfamily)